MRGECFWKCVIRVSNGNDSLLNFGSSYLQVTMLEFVGMDRKSFDYLCHSCKVPSYLTYIIITLPYSVELRSNSSDGSVTYITYVSVQPCKVLVIYWYKIINLVLPVSGIMRNFGMSENWANKKTYLPTYGFHFSFQMKSFLLVSGK